MRRIIYIAFVLAGCLAALPLCAQAPPAESQKPAAEAQKPGTAPQSSANPFPEDTSNVPVLSPSAAPPIPQGTYDGAESGGIPLPGDDLDPVHSPDDPAPVPNGPDSGWSSSAQGLEKLLPQPEDDQPGKKRKLLVVKEPTHKEAASKDIDVGTYYLQTKNWKGALSRFESALVLDPENPDVYWGLAEADRHLSNFADARANYEKVAEYDPDSRHGKDARKALNEPEIAKGKNAPPSQPPAIETQQ
jgi:tetratricopeptide (TPR) repeat protein